MEYLEDTNRFYVPGPDGGEDIAEMTFERQGDNVAAITHTYVNVNYRHQGIADRLFELVLEKMRAEGRKIIPICSYAVRKFERSADCQDMLARF